MYYFFWDTRWEQGLSWKLLLLLILLPDTKLKMQQSGVGSMQGKNTGNMPSAVCASSMNMSLAPLQYKCKVLH